MATLVYSLRLRVTLWTEQIGPTFRRANPIVDAAVSVRSAIDGHEGDRPNTSEWLQEEGKNMLGERTKSKWMRWAVGLLIASTCLQPCRSVAAKQEPDGPDQVYTWRAGGLMPDGNVIFADWDERAKIYLLSDYGFLMVNAGSVRHPKPAYLLGFLKQKRVEVCRTFPQFQAALKRIPRGARVYQYEVCTCGTAPGVGGAAWNRVERAFRKAHLKFDADRHVIYDICGEGADPKPDYPPELKANYLKVYGAAKRW